MEIKKDTKNPLLNRREVKIIVDSEKTPSFIEAAKLIADNFKASEENILVENVKGKFGMKTFLISASIYDTKELMEAAKKRATKVKKVAAPAA
jgi:ribosomal protein S24E